MKISIIAMKNGDKKRWMNAFSNHQILKFNSLITNALFLLTIILDNSEI
jgi:hypothetical protein